MVKHKSGSVANGPGPLLGVSVAGLAGAYHDEVSGQLSGNRDDHLLWAPALQSCEGADPEAARFSQRLVQDFLRAAVFRARQRRPTIRAATWSLTQWTCQPLQVAARTLVDHVQDRQRVDCTQQGSDASHLLRSSMRANRAKDVHQHAS